VCWQSVTFAKMTLAKMVPLAGPFPIGISNANVLQVIMETPVKLLSMPAMEIHASMVQPAKL